MTEAIMVLGTSSHAGKSLLAAGLCRALQRNGIKVAPFKAQNMSNNAAVTSDGGEIGRAQALQARACGLAPHTDMNPVLLKPSGRRTSQVVVRGRVRTTTEAADYHALAPQLWNEVAACYDRLAAAHDVIVLEGAGSCAELNLEWDFVNLKTARHAGAECLLVGDIERGGIFAQLLGTLDLLSPEDRSRIRATVVNKFRGDPSLFDSGRATLEDRSGIPVAGVLPFLDGLVLDEEDSLGIFSTRNAFAAVPDSVDIVVLHLPSISNFTDITVLLSEPDVNLRYVNVERRDPLGEPDAIILPGSKNTIADLSLLRESGYEKRILDAARNGAEIVGLCGGMQMMGRTLRDAGHVEAGGSADGLGLLPIRTEWETEKITRLATGTHAGLDAAFTGYEIHCGRTENNGGDVLVRSFEGVALGYGTERVWGTYVHGIFDSPPLRHAWLRRLRERKGLTPEISRSLYSVDGELDRVADAIRTHLILPGKWMLKLNASAATNG